MIERRQFIQGVVASGLMLAVRWRAIAAASGDAVFAPNAFVNITEDDWVVVIVKHHEMGQGVTTGIATLVAEELDADWARVRAEYAPSDPSRYNNLLFGPVQATGGSSAIRAGYEQMRRAGATARALLLRAAAQRWHVPVETLAAASGVVSHPSGKRATFGQLAAAASELPLPARVDLKEPEKFRLIGREGTRRLDTLAKTTGAAKYTSDIALPGLLEAFVVRPPAFGAVLRRFDATAVKAVPGVTDVVAIPEGVAVVATSTWAALRAHNALNVDWDMSAAAKLSSEALFAEYRAAVAEPGLAVTHSDETVRALASAARRVEAVYEFPFLAHATLEPMNCIAWLHDGQLETWAGHQSQTVDHGLAAKAAGLPLDRVKLHTLISGGSFGRRANIWADYVVEAVHVAKAIQGRAPVRVQSTRESDMRSGLYRPLVVHKVTAGLDKAGALVGWKQAIVGQPVFAGPPTPQGADISSIEGAWPTPYAIPNLSLSLHSTTSPVRVSWWRSVGHSHTAYVQETMLDELAVAAGCDPVQLRLQLLRAQPRAAAVIELAAQRAGWGDRKPSLGRGIAFHESLGTYVAQVAEVTIGKRGLPRLQRVVVAVDCGVVINPDIVRAQIEGGIGFAWSAALHSEITIERGQAVQSNFHDYPLLRFQEMPRVEAHIVPSRAAPTGVGEPGVPPLAPAVANAIFNLTGKRIRRLPFARHKLVDSQQDLR